MWRFAHKHEMLTTQCIWAELKGTRGKINDLPDAKYGLGECWEAEDAKSLKTRIK
jgi:hypothetical protein